MNNDQVLRMIFTHTFYYVTTFNDYYHIFTHDSDIIDDMIEAGFFTTLCMFLYDTRRLKGMSLREFIYNHSTKKYNKKGSKYYYRWDKYTNEYANSNYNSLHYDDQKLRQYRKRLLSSRKTYNHSSEWSAIRKGSEHEWKLYFILEDYGSENETPENIELHDTAKRIRTIYNDFYNSQKSSNNDVLVAYQKFTKKLSKLQYAQVLRLYKFFLEHIQNDPTYYGINLYRFERQCCLYSLTNEVNQLLKCDSNDERENVLRKSAILKDICFPKLYEYFSCIQTYEQMICYTNTYLLFIEDLVRTSRLIIDKFIDSNLFGEHWDAFFLNMINEMAESVLYNPTTIDYSVTTDSQSAFKDIISAPVKRTINYDLQCKSYFKKSDNDM